MSQVIAGETITIQLTTGTVVAKVEDASKSEAISARVIQSASSDHRIGDVHTFERSLLQKNSD